MFGFFFFFSSRRRHTRCSRDWSSDVCSSDLVFPSFRRLFSIVRMRQDRPHQLVEHLRFRLDRTARVGVYVPGAQLVQRRRLLVREPEQVFVSPAGRRVQDLAQDVGQVPRPAHGVVLRTRDREIHELPCFGGSRAKSSPCAGFSQGKGPCRVPNSSPPGSTCPSGWSRTTTSRP